MRLLIQALIWIPIGIISFICIGIKMIFVKTSGGDPKIAFRDHMEKGRSREEDLELKNTQDRLEREYGIKQGRRNVDDD